MSDCEVLFLDTLVTVLFSFIKSVYAPPAAQTFLPSLGDVITTPVTQVTVSAEGVVGGFDQPQWHSLHTKKPAAQLQSKKRGQSLSVLSAHLKLIDGVIVNKCVIILNIL